MTDATYKDSPTDAYFGAVTRRGAEAKDALKPVAKIAGDEDYEKLAEGQDYITPDGQKLTKRYRVSTDEEYDAIPEGAPFIGSDGTKGIKTKYEGVDVTSQTLYDMAVNDKERQKALERSYPGKVKRTKASNELYVDDDGVMRKPGHGAQATAGFALSSAAPVLSSVAGGTLGGAAGSVVPGAGTAVGGIAGAGLGGGAGQAFNDAILQLAGVYDRSVGEEAGNIGLATAFGAGGQAAGELVAGAGPYIKGKAKTALPGMAAHFLGADKAPEQLALGASLADRGVQVPVSPMFPESPHLANIAEVFEWAFKTQKPLLQSATEHYEKTGQGILGSMGVEGAGSLTKPVAAVPTEKAGVTLLNKTRQEMAATDKDLQTALEVAKAEKSAQFASKELSTPTRKALETSWDAHQQAANGLIKQGFDAIQTDIDAAMKVAKAGNNSGDLWWNVGEKLKQVRQGIASRAKVMYGEADQLAGAHLPDSEGLPEIAQQFIEQLPKWFEGKYPDIVRQLRDLAGEVDEHGAVIREPVHPTFGQLHNLRSIFRNNVNYHDLTPDIREGVYKFFAKRVDDVLHDANAVPPLRDAARALDKADAFYAENMRPLRDKNIQAVVSGLESGLPADPKNLFNVLVKEGRSDLTRKVAELVGPNLWAGVKAADVQDMLEQSKTLVPGQIDGKRFVQQVVDRVRSGMLEAVHDKEASAKLLQQAQHIAMLDGKLPVNVRPGDTVTEVIGKARAAADAAKDAAKRDPLTALQKEMKDVERDQARKAAALRRERKAEPLGFLYNPTTGATEAVDRILGNEDLILAAAGKFGETSKEFEMLRQVYAQRVLQDTLQPGERLAKISPEVQRIMFPGITLDQMQTLAKEMDFLMAAKGAGQNMAGGMSAMSKVEHPWATLIGGGGALSKVLTAPIRAIPGADAAGRAALGAYYTFIRKLVTQPAFLRWVEKGLKGDEAAREAARQVTQKFMRRGGQAGAATGEALYQTPSQQFMQPEFEKNEMPEGAKKAPDGKYYVPDPDRPGKYLRVEQ